MAASLFMRQTGAASWQVWQRNGADVMLGTVGHDGKGHWFVNDCNHRFTDRPAAMASLVSGDWLKYAAPTMASADVDLDPIIAKAKKLAALADRPGTPEEGANAAAKLQELLFKHNLDLWHVDDKATEYRQHEIETGDGWKRDLLFGVAKTNMCRGVFFRGASNWNRSGRRVKADPGRMEIMGQKHNLIFVEWLYYYLEGELLRLSDTGWDAYKTPYTVGKSVSWKTSFLVGAVATIRERLERQQRQFATAAGSREMVLATDKRLDEAFIARWPNLGLAKATSVRNWSAYNAGAAAADAVNLNRPVNGSATRGVLK